MEIANLLDAKLICTKQTLHIVPPRGPILDVLGSSRKLLKTYATELSRQIILKGLAERILAAGKGRKDLRGIPDIIDLEATLGNLKSSKSPILGVSLRLYHQVHKSI